MYFVSVVREFDHFSRVGIVLFSKMCLLDFNEPLYTEDVNMRSRGELRIPSGGC